VASEKRVEPNKVEPIIETPRIERGKISGVLALRWG
jgi:hypothetical protein